MNHSMRPTEPITDIQLNLHFDLAQRSQKLFWQFLHQGQDLYATTGEATGLILFEQASRLHISLQGCDSRHREQRQLLSDYRVIQAAIVTVPKVLLPPRRGEIEHYPPSPFDSVETAITPVMFGEPDDQGIAVAAELPPLCKFGYWEMSMYLTIEIPAAGGKHRPQYRVFRFDPELEVNNGSQTDDPPR
ncbi:hypothetical protein [Chitinimonas lacunae]|uniref:Uncharacterized protein n=1 Tax=Chitinimonas lacunae TaxID=1963018 RepID=A0ABV8MSR7_9NEIS